MSPEKTEGRSGGGQEGETRQRRERGQLAMREKRRGRREDGPLSVAETEREEARARTTVKREEESILWLCGGGRGGTSRCGEVRKERRMWEWSSRGSEK